MQVVEADSGPHSSCVRGFISRVGFSEYGRILLCLLVYLDRISCSGYPNKTGGTKHVVLEDVIMEFGFETYKTEEDCLRRVSCVVR